MFGRPIVGCEPGMVMDVVSAAPFLVEAEMAPPVIDWLEGQGLIALSEVRFPWGITDLVGIEVCATRMNERLRVFGSRPLGSLPAIQVLVNLPEEGTSMFSVGRVLEQSGIVYSERRLDQILQNLRRRGLLEYDGTIIRAKSKALRAHRRLVAVELKLSRQSEVIEQAIANCELSSESYVALPRERIEGAGSKGLLGRLAAEGIGLLSVSRTGVREELVPKALAGNSEDPTLAVHLVDRCLQWGVFRGSRDTEA